MAAEPASLRSWPPSERPRERLRDRGAAALSDAELLALILLGTAPGIGGVLATCRGLLQRHGGLSGLRSCTVAELCTTPGIGLARASALVAAVELARRLFAAGPRRGEPLTSSERVFRHIGGRLAGLQHEVFLVLALDARNQVTAIHQVAQGSATEVEVHPREVYSPLVRQGAASAIVAHNHPSGDCEPSVDDLRLTGRLKRAGGLLGIPLLDHLIVGNGGYVSLADRGLL